MTIEWTPIAIEEFDKYLHKNSATIVDIEKKGGYNGGYIFHVACEKEEIDLEQVMEDFTNWFSVNGIENEKRGIYKKI